MSVHRPTDLPSVRTQAYRCLISHFLASLGACINPCFDQLKAVKTMYPVTSIAWPYRGLRYRPTEFECFLKLSADKLLLFKWSQAQVCVLKIYMKYVVFISLWPSTIKILTSNLPRTRKFSQLFKNTGGEDLFLPWSRVGHALRPIFMLWLAKIWQVSSCEKFMQRLETCLLIAGADRVLCHLVMF